MKPHVDRVIHRENSVNMSFVDGILEETAVLPTFALRAGLLKIRDSHEITFCRGYQSRRLGEF